MFCPNCENEVEEGISYRNTNKNQSRNIINLHPEKSLTFWGHIILISL